MDDAQNLPVLRTPEGIVKTLDEWREFARRDDCLDRMVPSDLRMILSNLHPEITTNVKPEFVAANKELIDALTVLKNRSCDGSEVAASLLSDLRGYGSLTPPQIKLAERQIAKWRD